MRAPATLDIEAAAFRRRPAQTFGNPIRWWRRTQYVEDPRAPRRQRQPALRAAKEDATSAKQWFSVEQRRRARETIAEKEAWLQILRRSRCPQPSQ